MQESLGVDLVVRESLSTKFFNATSGQSLQPLVNLAEIVDAILDGCRFLSFVDDVGQGNAVSR